MIEAKIRSVVRFVRSALLRLAALASDAPDEKSLANEGLILIWGSARTSCLSFCQIWYLAFKRRTGGWDAAVPDGAYVLVVTTVGRNGGRNTLWLLHIIDNTGPSFRKI